MTNPSDEISALEKLFDEVKKLEKNPLRLNIPPSLSSFRFFGGNVLMEAFKTHSRTAKFAVGEHTRPMGTETSDIVLLVTHEYVKPNARILVDEKISFFQAKIERKDRLFKIKPRQWYLMRYWPNFSYKERQFILESCRRVPDVCSYYLLLSRKNSLSYSFYEDPKTWKCRINSICLSTPYIDEKMPTLKNLKRSELLKNNDVSLRLTQEDGDGFLDLMWDLILTLLGAHDSKGLTLMTTMFPDTSKANNPGLGKENNERPSVGIRLRVQLKTEAEGFPK
jgi:hypothetical protein